MELGVGDGLLIPKGWWHQVASTADTLALSLVVRLGQGNGNFK